MAPRSLLSLGLLFAASFLATWLVVGPREAPDAQPAMAPSGTRQQAAVPPETAPARDLPGGAIAAVDDEGEAIEPSPRQIDSLVTASVLGVDAVERATALTSLRQLQGGAGQDDRIRNAFRQAADDPDPLVAVVAQSALEDSQP
jgi:hypothetical protein